jgi:parallel beta-helix repeat protein/predicted outer membrane repeat protein
MGGGAIAATATININIVGGKFTGNSSGYYGGAISVGSTTATATNVSISGGTIIENSIGKTGSALWFKTTGAVTVDTITVQNNKNGTNGVIYITAGTHTYNNVTATGNQSNKGGVFYISGGIVEITNSLLTENTASGNDGLGGAIYVSTSNTLTLKGCTISDNEAKVGGGVYATKSFTADEATQITDNTDSSEGADTDNVYPAA